MNDKDKEAYEKFYHSDLNEYNSDYCITQKDASYIWKTAIAYKQKEIDELKVEISRLVNCVEFYATTGILNDEHDFFILKDFKISVPTTRRARQLMQIYSNIYTKYEE